MRALVTGAAGFIGGQTPAEGSAECRATKWNRSGNRYRDHVSQAKYHVRKIER